LGKTLNQINAKTYVFAFLFAGQGTHGIIFLMKNKSAYFFTALLATFFLFSIAYGATSTPKDLDFDLPKPSAQTPIACEAWKGGLLEGVCKDPSKLEFCHLFVLLDNIINWIMFVAMPIAAFLLLVWGGFNYIIYLENPANAKKFWDTAKALLWGAIVVYAAYAVVNLFLIIVGAKIFSPEAGLGQWFKFPCGTGAPPASTSTPPTGVSEF